MRTARKPKRLRPHAKSFQECLREFLTPVVWKQAQQARAARRESARWKTQTLVLVLLTMTWCCGDSTAERFETAKAVTAALLPKRKRPGKSVQGFQKALAKLPVPVLRAVGEGIRRALLRLLKNQWLVNGFVPLGCDGSRVECPRSAELEQRLGKAGKDGSAPTLWITALVHVRLGVPWAWRWGKGNASERGHLVQLVRQLPKAALVIADAGYVGFDLARTLAAADVAFLIRLSSVVALYSEGDLPRSRRFREGHVYYWSPRKRRVPPLPIRLIRVRGKKTGDVWLMTNVMDRARLSHAWAGQFYRWRWESEGLFRTYKRTLAKVKLMSRSVRLVHREAEGSMLATQLLLAQGAWGVRPPKQETSVACSARKVLLAIREEIAVLSTPRRRVPFGQRLRGAGRERRCGRRSAKVRREWPRPRPTTPPNPPRILKLTEEQKRVIHQLKTTSCVT
jgi:Transposase DDE domain